MSKLTVEFPESLRAALAAAAARDGVSMDQMLALAVAEKLSALATVDYLRRQAAGARREDFERYLAAVPERQPVETDRLPE